MKRALRAVYILLFCIGSLISAYADPPEGCGCAEGETNTCLDLDPCSPEFIDMIDECCQVGIPLEDDIAMAILVALGVGLGIYTYYGSKRAQLPATQNSR